MLSREGGHPTGRPLTFGIRFATTTGSVDEVLPVWNSLVQYTPVVGDHVAVVYDPRDPARVRPNGSLGDFWGDLIFVVVGGATVALAIRGIVTALRQRFSRPAPLPG